ncbi:hypothetical protein VKT23_017784 [Stygiomarasmius scandens]|uniref:Uncharacterized protein n=1 Tax=Marasmiellus scandens TaxID=2682957 RepID=A0ABR1IV44_9AGAR
MSERSASGPTPSLTSPSSPLNSSSTEKLHSFFEFGLFSGIKSLFNPRRKISAKPSDALPPITAPCPNPIQRQINLPSPRLPEAKISRVSVSPAHTERDRSRLRPPSLVTDAYSVSSRQSTVASFLFEECRCLKCKRAGITLALSDKDENELSETSSVLYCPVPARRDRERRNSLPTYTDLGPSTPIPLEVTPVHAPTSISIQSLPNSAHPSTIQSRDSPKHSATSPIPRRPSKSSGLADPRIQPPSSQLLNKLPALSLGVEIQDASLTSSPTFSFSLGRSDSISNSSDTHTTTSHASNPFSDSTWTSSSYTSSKPQQPSYSERESVTRKHPKQGWSGEWNVDDIDIVIKKLRILKN